MPAEMIDHIDVIRGPAAARYGNGAMGGVVNIVTKPTSDEWHGSWNTYLNAPQHRKEGSTKRTNFSLSGPLSDTVSFDLWGNMSKTQTDAQDINSGHEAARTGTWANSYPAGREGVINKDIHGKVRWDLPPCRHWSLNLAIAVRATSTRVTPKYQHQHAGEKHVWQRDQPPLSPDLRPDVDRRLG